MKLHGLLILMFFSGLGLSVPFESPSCNEIKNLWNNQFVHDLNVAEGAREIAEDCDNPQGRTAYALEYLHRFMPEMYNFVKGKVKKLNFETAPKKENGEPDPEGENTLADAENETGLITIYDALTSESREYIASQIAHEAAHLRQGDIDHVTCLEGELKGDAGSCAETFTGERTGDAYNFTFWVLKKFHELADTHEEISKEEARKGIRYILKNNFNQVPAEVLAEWNVDRTSEERFPGPIALERRRFSNPPTH